MDDAIYLTMAFLQILAFMILGYYTFLGLFGLYRKKEVKNYTPKNKFAMIIAAHNEEVVIRELIKSIYSLDYPKNLYKIFVIADNCSDNTAKVAREAGAVVFERFDCNNKGKGFALEWMFHRLYKMDEKFDSVCIFDADNLVHPDFLKEINSKMYEGYKIVQGYIDSKNPNDTWISTCGSVFTWSQNRMFQLSRSNVGFSNQLGGTGFAMDYEVLRELGWGAHCLTEDLEFTSKYVLSGGKVGWAHDAIIYDEKTLNLKASWVQRRRWMQGFSDVASKYFVKLFKKAVKERKWYIFDCALYVLQPFATVLLAIATSFTAFQMVFPYEGAIPIVRLIGDAGFQGLALAQLIITPLVLILDKKINKKMFVMLLLFSGTLFALPVLLAKVNSLGVAALSNIIFYGGFLIITFVVCGFKGLVFFFRFLLYALYNITWAPISLLGILRRKNKEWNPTKHVRSVEICDM